MSVLLRTYELWYRRRKEGSWNAIYCGELDKVLLELEAYAECGSDRENLLVVVVTKESWDGLNG